MEGRSGLRLAGRREWIRIREYGGLLDCARDVPFSDVPAGQVTTVDRADAEKEGPWESMYGPR